MKMASAVGCRALGSERVRGGWEAVLRRRALSWVWRQRAVWRRLGGCVVEEGVVVGVAAEGGMAALIIPPNKIKENDIDHKP